MISEVKESVKEYGVIMPVVVRSTEEGGYKMISRYRRLRVCEAVCIDDVPAIVRNIEQYEVIVMMVDSNLPQENILPSEKHFYCKPTENNMFFYINY